MTVQPGLTATDGRPTPGEPLAIAFANTRYAVHGTLHEGLASPAHLAAWLRANAALPASPNLAATGPSDLDDAGLAAFVGLRDAIRSLIQSALDGEPPHARDLRLLNAAAGTAPAWPVLRFHDGVPGIVERTAETAARTALGAIARDAVRVLGGARRDAVRACQAPGCVQYFLKDHPRREWCCAACGNRARVARHYQRRKGGR